MRGRNDIFVGTAKLVCTVIVQFWIRMLNFFIDRFMKEGISRTDVMRPQFMPISILAVIAMVSLIYSQHVMFWVLVGLLVCCLFWYQVIYWKCLKVDPNLLRSEKYNIEKRRIDAQVGDSESGDFGSNVIENVRPIEVKDARQIGGGE